MTWVDRFVKTIPLESKYFREVWFVKHKGEMFAVTVQKSITGWELIKVV